MSILEKSIERRVCQWAKEHGILAIKLNGIGQRSWPDRLFVGHQGQAVYVEFKTVKGVVTPLQKHAHDQLATRGHAVYVVRDAKTGIKLLNAYFLNDTV